MILTADYLLTGDGETLLEKGAVRVEGKKLSAVGTLQELKERYPGEEITAFEGATLMPGLVDLHNHISYVWGTPLEPIYNRYPMTKAFFAMKRMKDTLENGVTTIRDVASADHIGVSIKYAKQFGFIDAPRVFTSCRGILMTGGHGWSLEGGVVECDGPQEVRKAVRTQVRDGADLIKILTSEGYRGVEMSQEEIDAACDEAHRLGVRVASHAGYGPSIQMSIDGGCDTIEHGTHLTLEQAKYMKEHDQTWVPTIYCFSYVKDMLMEQANGSDEFFMKNAKYIMEAMDCYENNLVELYNTGVRIACGTDTDCADYPEAAPVYLECEAMVKCGLTPMQVIACATKNGAEALGCGEEFGQLKEGMSADVLVVSGKPFENIKDLHNVRAVWLEGKQVVAK